MKNHIGILGRILGYYLLYILLANTVMLLILFLEKLVGISLPTLQGEFITDLLILPILILVFGIYKQEKRIALLSSKLELKKILLLVPISLGARLALVIALAIIAAVLLLIIGKDIGSVIDQGVDYQWDTFDKSQGWDKLFGFLSFVILGPINEELLNRAVIFEYLRKHYSVHVSIIYSSVIFMFAHVHPGLYLSSFILGIILAYTYVKWKNIWYPIILHMLINVQPFILAYFLER